jgi:hypothetical protein
MSVMASLPMRRGDVVQRRRRSGAALLDPANARLHVVNYTALAIWQLCDGETDPEEMVDAVCELSGLPREVAAEDVRNALTEFDAAGLITWSKE